MRVGSYVLGFHGCDRAVGERVLAGEADLRVSANDYDWLGEGIYFWENNPSRAMEWARLVMRHGFASKSAIREPFVIGAILDLGNCLDLLEEESIRAVESSYRLLAETSETAGIPLPQNKIVAGELAVRRLDCHVINMLHHDRSANGRAPFDSVRAAFVEGAALYPGAGFHRQTHIQVCVRSWRQVVGYFRPRAR